MDYVRNKIGQAARQELLLENDFMSIGLKSSEVYI